MSSSATNPTDSQTMLSAAADGDADTIQWLLQHGISINTVGRLGDQSDDSTPETTPLIIAVQKSNLEAIKVLLANGVDVNFRTEDEDTALLNAAYLGHAEVLSLLLDHGADMHFTTRHGCRSALHEAVSDPFPANVAGKLQAIDYLIDRGISLNITAEHEQTPLHLIAQSGASSLAEKLLSRGANVNSRNQWGDTPLDTAATHGSNEVLQLLVSRGAIINTANGGCTGFGHAVIRGHLEVIAFLLQHGAKSSRGCFPDSELLHAARLPASEASKDMLDLLWQNGFKGQGSNALLHASLVDQPAVIQRLVDMGISPHVTDQKGKSALHMAVLGRRFERANIDGIKNPRIDVVNYLIAIGVDASLKDNEGKTAGDIATEVQFSEAVALLKH